MIKVGQVYDGTSLYNDNTITIEITSITPLLIHCITDNYQGLEKIYASLGLTTYWREALTFTIKYNEFKKAIENNHWKLNTITTMQNMVELYELGLINENPTKKKKCK